MNQAHLVDILEPGALIAAARALYDASQEARECREECVAHYIAIINLESAWKEAEMDVRRTEVTISQQLGDILRTIWEVVSIIRSFIVEPFLFRVIHRRRVRWRLRKVQTLLHGIVSVREGLEMFDDPSTIKQKIDDIARSRQVDQRKGVAEFVELCKKYEHNMIETLGIKSGQIPDAMIALAKYTKGLAEGPEKMWCDGSLEALRKDTGVVHFPNDRFSLSSFEVIVQHDAKLGKGSSAEVYRGILNDVAVAVKIPIPDTSWSVLEQGELCKDLSHPNILQFIGACPTADPPFIVSELKQKGNVLEYLRIEPKASRSKILYDASLGLVYLHDRDIVHGNLKARNILIDSTGIACLSDFGLSYTDPHTSTVLDRWSQARHVSPRWMAPEQLRGSPASRSSDIYSFAMTIYEVFTGQPPFPETPDTMLYALVCERGVRPRFDNIPPSVVELGLDETMWSVVESCWSQDPRGRWTAIQLRDGIFSINMLYSLQGGPQDINDSADAASLVKTQPPLIPLRPSEGQQPRCTKPMMPFPSHSTHAIVPRDPESIQFFPTGPLGLVMENDPHKLTRRESPAESLATLGTGVSTQPIILSSAYPPRRAHELLPKTEEGAVTLSCSSLCTYAPQIDFCFVLGCFGECDSLATY